MGVGCKYSSSPVRIARKIAGGIQMETLASNEDIPDPSADPRVDPSTDTANECEKKQAKQPARVDAEGVEVNSDDILGVALAPARQAHAEGVNLDNSRITYIEISKGMDDQDAVRSLFVLQDCPKLREELRLIPEEKIEEFRTAALQDTNHHWIFVFDKIYQRVSVCKVPK